MASSGFVLPNGTYVASAGYLATSTTSTGTGANTDETTLYSYTLPANCLDSDNGVVKITAAGTLAANANAKTVKLKVGTTTLVTLSDTYNNGAYYIEATLIGTASAQNALVHARITIGSAITQAIDAIQTGMTEDNTAGLAIVVTGTNDVASANDIVQKFAVVEYIQNP